MLPWSKVTMVTLFFSVKKRHRIVFGTLPVFTCSKLTIETLEQDVKYVQS